MTLILLSGQIEYKKYSGLSGLDVQRIWKDKGGEIPNHRKIVFTWCLHTILVQFSLKKKNSKQSLVICFSVLFKTNGFAQ